jgi:cytoskeleton protein RodZ
MEESVAGSADTRSLGQVLSQERERQGLARADVAQRLHMSPSQVEALETGDYARLPSGTFLRGFVRNYARVLHLDAEKLLPLLADVAPVRKSASIVVPSEKIRFDPMGQRLGNPYVKAAGLAVVAVALGFAAMYWWFFIRPTPPATEAKKPAAPVVAKGAPQQVAVAPISPAETPPPTEAPREAVPPENSPVAPSMTPAADAKGPPSRSAADAKAAKSKADASNAEAQKTAIAEAAKAGIAPVAVSSSAVRSEGDRKLAFRFLGESWVEIKDANGRTLMSKTNPAGSATEVFGRAPFTVVVGNAPEVQMSFDDRPLDLQPHSRVGVARLTVK